MKPVIFGLVIMLISVYVFADKVNKSIGQLKTTEYILVFANGEDGLVYKVKDIEGKVLENALSDDQLALKFPGLKALIDEGIADDASLTPYINRHRSLKTETNNIR